MYELKFTIATLPKSLNKALRTNRFKANRQNKVWDLMIAAKCARSLPKEPLKSAHLKVIRHAHRTLDYDGLVGSLKPVVDALVSCGVLSDDSWSVLGAWDVSQCYRPKSAGPLLEISLVETMPIKT